MERKSITVRLFRSAALKPLTGGDVQRNENVR